MIDVRAEVTTTDLIGRIGRQVPFATSVAINNTAKDFQKVQRQHMGRAFTVRRRAFVERSVKIKPFSTKNRLEAKVAIDPPGGQARADILAKFEEGGRKVPRGTSLAIPEDVRRGKSGVVPRSQRPRSFTFRLVGSGPKAKVYKGRRRTFMIKGPGGTGGIYQRVGARRSGRRLASTIATRRVRDMGIRTLYRFTPYATIDERLKFVEHAKDVVKASFARNFRQALNRAIGATGGDRATKQQRRIARADVFGSDRR